MALRLSLWLNSASAFLGGISDIECLFRRDFLFCFLLKRFRTKAGDVLLLAEVMRVVLYHLQFSFPSLAFT